MNGIALLKTFTSTLSALISGSAFRPSLHAGLGLAQVGEFSFVLAIGGKTFGLIDDDFSVYFVCFQFSLFLLFSQLLGFLEHHISLFLSAGDCH